MGAGPRPRALAIAEILLVRREGSLVFDPKRLIGSGRHRHRLRRRDLRLPSPFGVSLESQGGGFNVKRSFPFLADLQGKAQIRRTRKGATLSALQLSQNFRQVSLATKPNRFRYALGEIPITL
jgi:hypothetical protein